MHSWSLLSDGFFLSLSLCLDIGIANVAIISLARTGLMNKQIAGIIGLSEITVKVHRGSLMRKMEARSLAELVLMAERLKPSA